MWYTALHRKIVHFVAGVTSFPGFQDLSKGFAGHNRPLRPVLSYTRPFYTRLHMFSMHHGEAPLEVAHTKRVIVGHTGAIEGHIELNMAVHALPRAHYGGALL
jgi:hypothetical protein